MHVGHEFKHIDNEGREKAAYIGSTMRPNGEFVTICDGDGVVVARVRLGWGETMVNADAVDFVTAKEAPYKMAAAAGRG